MARACAYVERHPRPDIRSRLSHRLMVFPLGCFLSHSMAPLILTSFHRQLPTLREVAAHLVPRISAKLRSRARVG